jgi:hypothetical protein
MGFAPLLSSIDARVKTATACANARRPRKIEAEQKIFHGTSLEISGHPGRSFGSPSGDDAVTTTHPFEESTWHDPSRAPAAPHSLFSTDGRISARS